MSIIDELESELEAAVEQADTEEEVIRTSQSVFSKWLKSHRIACLDEDEAIAYGEYLAYKAQWALYQISVHENPKVVSWEEFVFGIQNSKELRDAAVAVIIHAISTFPRDNYFNFKLEYLEDDAFDEEREPFDENGVVHSAQLYPPEMGAAIVGMFTFIAEDIYYNIYRNEEARASNTWDQYIEDLLHNPDLWHPLQMAVRDAITKIDFTKAWESEEIRETEFLRRQNPSVENKRKEENDMEMIQKMKPGRTLDREEPSNESARLHTVLPAVASVRKVDELGRIMLTGAARNLLHVCEGDSVKISVDTEKGVILVRKAEASETKKGRDPFVRKADQLGRIVLPVEIRAHMDIQEGELLDILSDPDGNQVCLKKAVAKCLKCGSSDNLTEIRFGYHLCASCIETISVHN